MNPCELLDPVRHIAFGAGRRILDVYEQGFTVTDKSDRTPDIAVLSEEPAPAGPEIRRGWKFFWLVDPLDGTKEFISRNGEFTVNIAIVENGRPVLGVVPAPVSRKTYWGA